MSDSTRSWIRPRPDAAGYRRDAVVAGGVLVLAVVSTLLHAIGGVYPTPAPIWVSAVLLVGLCVPLAARRRYPATVALAIAVVVVVFVSVRVPELLLYNIALFIAIYTVGAWSTDRGRATVVRGVIVAGMFTWLFIVLVGQLQDPPAMAGLPEGVVSPAFVAIAAVQILTNLLYFAGAWYFGDRAWAAARERAALEDRTRELARERGVSAAQAIALERVRIARELHDVVAHHVSLMGIQAGAARRVLSTDQELAAGALASIESSARTAVDELHRLLITLRSDETDDAPAVTDIARIGDLVSETEESGVRVRYSVIGDVRAIPATTSVTAYRVAREALTNVRKHGGVRASVDLRVRYLDSAVEIEVADDGVGVGSGQEAAAGGLGLIGMRERVLAVGGELSAGHRSRGGYLVRATLPASPATAAADASAPPVVGERASTSPMEPSPSSTGADVRA